MKTRYLNPAIWVFRILAVICMATSFDAVCFARLGETEEQLKARYGKASDGEDPENAWDDKTLIFHVPGPAGGEIAVLAYLVDGISVAENYVFFNKDGSDCPITGPAYDAAKAIVNANSQGQVWKGLPGVPPPAMELVWIRPGASEATAIVWKNQPNVLEIVTAESQKRMEQHKQGIRGF